jgi:hypothetical protein
MRYQPYPFRVPMTSTPPSKAKKSFYRRLYLAFVIDAGINTVSALLEETNMPRRTLQDTLKNASDLDIAIESHGGTKNTHYSVVDWGAIDKSWVQKNIEYIKETVGTGDPK